MICSNTAIIPTGLRSTPQGWDEAEVHRAELQHFEQPRRSIALSEMAGSYHATYAASYNPLAGDHQDSWLNAGFSAPEASDSRIRPNHTS